MGLAGGAARLKPERAMKAAAFAGLPRASVQYLRDLAANNNRDWFEANRDRYETEWLNPGLDLAEALAPFAAKMEPPLLSRPKLNASVRRIHRDVRFSADKRPYEPMLHLILSTGNEFNKVPGFHIVLTPAGLGWGAGAYGLAPEVLETLRRRICDDGQRRTLLDAVAAANRVGSTFGQPDLARVPKGFAGEPDWEHLLRRKSLILRTQTETPAPDWLFSSEAPERLAAIARAHLPLLGWLDGKA